MDEEYAVKMYSLCQDLVYNGNKGRTQTPKSLALAMAVRQMSGCSGLIHILNGLGHCVSLSSTMAYDSAIVQLVIETSDIFPREFVAGQSINLVYDNIDFGEEVKKQMHVTNGIITQKVSHSHQIMSERDIVTYQIRSIQYKCLNKMQYYLALGIRRYQDLILKWKKLLVASQSRQLHQRQCNFSI